MPAVYPGVPDPPLAPEELDWQRVHNPLWHEDLIPFVTDAAPADHPTTRLSDPAPAEEPALIPDPAPADPDPAAEVPL